MNRRKIVLSLLIPGLLLLAGALIAADIVTFRDGRVLEGKVIEEGEETIVFQREGRDPINIHRELIDSITYAEGRPRHPDEVEELEFLAGREYLNRVSERFESAERSIKVMMYLASNTGRVRCAGNILMGELDRARRRGVEVRVVLEGSHVEQINNANLRSAEWLLGIFDDIPLVGDALSEINPVIGVLTSLLESAKDEALDAATEALVNAVSESIEAIQEWFGEENNRNILIMAESIGELRTREDGLNTLNNEFQKIREEVEELHSKIIECPCIDIDELIEDLLYESPTIPEPSG